MTKELREHISDNLTVAQALVEEAAIIIDNEGLCELADRMLDISEALDETDAALRDIKTED